MQKSLLFVLVLSAPAAAQTTWHVDVNGTPPGTGTPGDPYTSIQYAIDSVTTVDGDTVLVAPGFYEEEVDLRPKHIEVRASDGPLTTTIQSPVGATGFTLTLDHFSGPVTPMVEGFTIAGRPGGGTYGVSVVAGAVLRGCVVRGHRSTGAPGGGGIGIEGYLFGSRVESCTILDNDIGASDHGHFGDISLDNCVLAANDLDLRYVGVGVFANWSAWTIQSGTVSGANNLLVDPGLWNAPQGDPHLAPSSVCIDSGNPTLPLDPDGSAPDRGALPYDSAYLPPATFYCTAKLNTGGCQALISLKGGTAASVSSNVPFRVEATGVVENVQGLLFFGTSGRRAVPFMGGLHCVEPPVTRTPAQASGDIGPTACQGLFIFDFNAYLKTPPGSLLDAGQMVDAQYWYRDPSDPFGSATSDAVEFPIGL